MHPVTKRSISIGVCVSESSQSKKQNPHTLRVPPTPCTTRKLHIRPKIIRHHALFRRRMCRWRTVRSRPTRLLAIPYIGIRVSEKGKWKGNGFVNVIAKITQGGGTDTLGRPNLKEIREVLVCITPNLKEEELTNNYQRR